MNYSTPIVSLIVYWYNGVMTDMQAQTDVVEDVEQKKKKKTRSGRPYLDGSPPGAGHYMQVVALSLRSEDKKLFFRAGAGNRSLGLRRLVDAARQYGLLDRLLDRPDDF